MGWLKELKKVVKHVVNPDVREHLPGRRNSYSLLGMYQHGQDAKKDAAKEGAALRAKQQAVLAAQADNALADLTLENTPDIIAGGTADALMGGKRKRRASAGQSIATQLGL